MSSLLVGLLGVLAATNASAALSNTLAETTGISLTAPGATNAVEKEYQALMDQDDRAQAEVDKWIRENQAFEAKGAGVPAAQLKARILDRLEPVRQGYEAFLEKHPHHTRARVAYASFLSDTKSEESAQEQLEKALAADTNSPAVYNNLANIYGHLGPVKKAFEFYEKAITLNPREAVYYHNFGTTVFLFRKDAREYFGFDETQVFAKAFQLYSNSMRLDPANFSLAADVAQTYYGVKPLRTDEALNAWTNALKIAADPEEREGVFLHFARLKMAAGRFAEAHTDLAFVTNQVHADLKQRLERNLALQEFDATNSVPTNAAPASLPAKPGPSK